MLHFRTIANKIEQLFLSKQGHETVLANTPPDFSGHAESRNAIAATRTYEDDGFGECRCPFITLDLGIASDTSRHTHPFLAVSCFISGDSVCDLV